ncbi:MAG: DNA polymerase III subunit alpha [Devosia nanyangense]|uniref:DNA polymerase III subunit alpha n=1 Tax=Devosia nanyangense TaxID=1228055 RepID=A0A933NYS7_9HYPH|nr:DNA polymerase III subunit alpha [Devosia nanyangense]
MPGPGFIHLHIHSAYSLLEGALSLGRLLDLAKADKQPALGIADTNNLFGALEFSEKAAGKGIQPLLGCELTLDFEPPSDRVMERNHDRGQFGKGGVVLIAASETGFGNLSRLVSKAYLEGETGRAAAQLAWLDRQNLDGIICLSGGPEGAIDPWFAQGLDAQAEQRLEALRELFGDRFYVELQRHRRPQEHSNEARLIDYAYRRGVPLVATNEPFFAGRDDYEAHDALLAIAAGSVVAQTERRKLTPEHYFKSRDEMAELFADLPEALDNSVEIAQRVSYRPKTRGPILPRFAAAPDQTEAEGLAAEAERLRVEAREGLRRRFAGYGMADGFTEQQYQDRLEFELGVIIKMKYPGYFLIVADFIQWAKAQDIPVGPGRGSGAGSLVAYALTITDLDPLRYDLLFERFLNPDRVSMPDFDIDFCQDRRGEVIKYVQGKYGEAQVAQIITFGTLQAKAVVRDVGRVLQMPYGQVDRISKMIPANPANPVTLAQALDMEPQLKAMRDSDESVAQLIAIAQKLEGLYRHASTHAAGIVIGERPLTELVPMYRDPRSDMPVTQYSLKWVEPAGLVKFDFLGLKTLTVLDNAVKMINRNGQKFALTDIPIADAETFDKLTKGDVVGVFQVESPGMRRALVDMRPDRFEDLIALVALYRPGPMANIPVYCKRKNGEEDVEYLHPLLEPILAATYGVITYQEQVQQIARALAGYTLAEADLLRRAMGKKIKSEMDAQRGRFLEGAAAKGIGKALASTIFDACAKFAEYGFNKSHSAPYAYITYQTAYLKAHHTQEFIAASMTYDMGNTDKLSEFREDAKKHGIAIVAPSVNTSEATFSARDGKIFYAIGAIKGVGQAVAEHIVSARGTKPFADLADFATRVDPRIINKRTLETLVNAGAFDCLVPKREQAFAAIDSVVATAQRTNANASDGIADMFAADVPEPIRLTQNVEPWNLAERLERERGAIGFHISAHPLDDYAGLFEGLKIIPYARFEHAVKEGDISAGRLAGTIATRADRRTKKGTPMLSLSLSDPSGSYEVVGFSEAVEQYGKILQPGRSVILSVEADERPDGVSLRLLSAQPLDEAVLKAGRRLTIFAGDMKALGSIRAQLKSGGEGQVTFIVSRDNGAKEYEIELRERFQLTPAVAGGIKSLDGVVDVRLN